MTVKKLISFVTVFAVLLCLTGCDIFTVDTDTLMTPPELNGEMQPIARALSASIKGEYHLKYPSLGDIRSAIILEDVTGDGVFEAFAFYSTSDDEMTNMHINVICRTKEGYKSTADSSIVAGGVERVDFCDLDGDGIKEILVGWEIYGSSEKQLCVYSLNDNKLTQRLSEKYTGFICGDITGESGDELLVHLLNTSDMINSAAVYRFFEDGIQKIGSCVLDSLVKTVSQPVLSKLSTGVNAVYIDEIKGAGAVTEVLFFEGGQLKNPLLDTQSTIENIRTLRSASIQSRDIDDDGVLEIPVATNLPNAAGTDEALFYTNWCAFDGESLVTRRITVENTIDGYYLQIPERYAGRLAVLKDVENHRRVFYGYDTESDSVGERLATVSVVLAKQWDKEDFNRMNMFELCRAGNNVYIASVNLSAKLALTEQELTDMFNLSGDRK